MCEQKSSDRAFFREKVAYLDCTMMKQRSRKGFAEADPIIHHVQCQYQSFCNTTGILAYCSATFPS